MHQRRLNRSITAIAALVIAAVAFPAAAAGAGSGSLSAAFATKEFRKVLRPVIGMETFNAGPRGAADEFLRP